MRSGEGATLGYLIAAYALVVGSLAAYGLWIERQRRALMRGEREPGGRPGAPSGADPAGS